ncbi:MAG: NAD-dependent epimerase/dehydratase family protein [Ignavibacteria bacterium]
MKSFVTGATGFVGSHLVDRLLKEEHQVFCLVRKTSNTRWLDNKPVVLIKDNLDSENVREVLAKTDFVFNVAGVVKAKDYNSYYQGNVVPTQTLLEILSQVKPDLKKFIHISSQAVCGPNPDDNPIDETYEPRPITSYGKTKLLAEKEVLKKSNVLKTVILRPSAIFGPRDTEILVYFKTFMKGLNAVIGFNEKYLSLIYIEDFIDAIYKAVFSDLKSGEVFFVSSDRAYSWDNIATVTAQVIGKKAFKLRIPHWIVYTVGAFSELFSMFSGKATTLNLEKCKDITRKRWVCSNKKIKSLVGWNEQYSLQEGFKITLDWYKSMGWL